MTSPESLKAAHSGTEGRNPQQEPYSPYEVAVSRSDVLGPERRKRVRVTIYRIGLAAFLLTAWQLVADRGIADASLISSPVAAWSYFMQNGVSHPALWESVGSTLQAVAIAFTLGSALGIFIGFLLISSQTLHRVADFYLTLLNSFPRVALAPAFVVIFGLGLASKVVTAVTVIVFIVISGTIAAAESVDQDLVTLFRTYGASRVVVFRRLILPWSVPAIAESLKLALIFTVVNVVVTEMIAGNSGIGFEVSLLANSYRMDGVIATLFVLAIITSGLAEVMNMAERYLIRWKEQ